MGKLPSYQQRVNLIANLLSLLGASEQEIERFVSNSMKRQDRRMLAYFAHYHLRFWDGMFGRRYRSDIVEYTQRAYASLSEQMLGAYDSLTGAHVLIIPGFDRWTRYHYVPFEVRGYKRATLELKRCNVPLLVKPDFESVEDSIRLMFMLKPDPRRVYFARYLLSIADEHGDFELSPRYYERVARCDKRYAQFILSRLRQEGHIVLLQPGRFYVRSRNRIVSPSQLRFAIDLCVALQKSLGEWKEDEDGTFSVEPDNRDAIEVA